MPRKGYHQINLLMPEAEFPYTFLAQQAEKLDTTAHMIGREMWGERMDLIKAGWGFGNPTLFGVLKGVAHLDKKRYKVVCDLVAEHLAEVITRTGHVPDCLAPRPPFKPRRRRKPK